MTNATKAALIAALNAGLVLVVSFGVEVSDSQQAAIIGAANALLALWIGLTYTQSRKRIAD